MQWGQPGNSTPAVAQLTDAQIAQLAADWPCHPPAVAGSDRFNAWLVWALQCDTFARLTTDFD